MNIELRHLRAFQAVADHLNFHRAAGELHLSQPALSRQVAQLEEELGRELFSREKRRISLTQAGRYLYKHVGEGLEAVELLLRQTREAAEGSRGVFSMGYTEAAMASFLPVLLRRLRKKMPEVDLRLQQGHSDPLLREVLRGRLDAAFVSLPAREAGLKCLPVARERLGIVLPENHRLAARREIAFASLAWEKFILFPYGSNPKLYSDLLAHCRQAGFAPQIVEESASWILAVNLVAAGVGLCFLSEPLRHYCAEGTVFRLLKEPRSRIEFYLAEAEPGDNPCVGELKKLLHPRRR